MNTLTETNQPKIGAWKGSFLLARASWSTLKLDSEMMWLPIYSFILSVIATAIIGTAAWYSGILQTLDAESSITSGTYWAQILVFGAFALSQILIHNFFTGAIISAAFHRFNGKNPTIPWALNQAKAKFASIAKFSIISAVVSVFFQKIQESNIPFLGKLTAVLGNIAWNVATVFAIPAIMASDTPLGPIETVKKSATIFKKAWKQEFVGGLGLGLVTLVVILPIFILGLIAGTLAAIQGLYSLAITLPLLLAALIFALSLTSALNSIFYAALYHFAETGESPKEFDENLLKAAFQPRKKWFI